MNIIISKIRERLNLTVLIQTLLAIVMPIGVYYGITVDDITSWSKLLNIFVQALLNPAVIIAICISLWQTFNNPTVCKFSIPEKVEIEKDLYDNKNIED